MNRDIIFLIPPVSDFTMPQLAPYILKDYLNTQGFESFVYDMSINFFHNVLDKNCLNGINDKVTEAIAELLSDVIYPSQNINNLILANRILNSLSDSIFFSLDGAKYKGNINDIQYLSGIVCDINRLIPLLFNTQLNELLNIDFNYCGISITYLEQLPFSLSIANFIKDNHGKKIILGGTFFSNISPELLHYIETLPYIDFIITGAGETVLIGILKNNALHDSECKIHIFPDYNDVEWNKYFVSSNVRAVPFSFRTACYWGKCSFCSGDSFNCEQLTVDKTMSIVKIIKQRFNNNGITHVYITDAALPPEIMTAFAESIDGDFLWCINARVEKSYSLSFLNQLYDGGCFMLRVGIESASQNVLNKMCKGCSVLDYDSYLINADKVGIKSHIYLMYGFPGEENEDFVSTYDFIKMHIQNIYSYSISTFHAIPHTKIYNEMRAEYLIDDCKIINQMYYSDGKYTEVMNRVKKTEKLLLAVHNNSFCFGGRVFMEHPEPKDNICRGILQNE